MKIFWVGANFLHPTNKGGHIRTLEMLRHLRRWHEIHYAAIEDPFQPEGPARSGEYCARAYPYRYRVPDKNSWAFYGQLAAGLFSPVPLAVSRFCPRGIKPFLRSILARERFDRAVLDFLPPTAWFPDLAHSVLFQHNVETLIWRRHAEHATGARRAYFRMQAGRMFRYERSVCRAAGRVVAVSSADALQICSLFGVEHVTAIPTGVDVDFFAPPLTPPRAADLVFVGSMDWLPNVDGVAYFIEKILPLVRRHKPDCTVAIAGRMPPEKLVRMSQQDPGIIVTGTVPDVRPYLWGSSVSIVPLRIGGGTRLKIYESMAAGVPVVSTTVGAEGLDIDPPRNILVADDPERFAAACLCLLGDAGERARMAAEAREMVRARYSWEQVSRCFDAILATAPALPRLTP